MMSDKQEKAVHGILIFQQQRLVFANTRAAEIIGYSRERLSGFSQDGWLMLICPDDRARIQTLQSRVEMSGMVEPETGVCLIKQDGSSYRVDVLITMTLYEGATALQVIWIDRLSSLQAEDGKSHQQANVMRDIMAALAGAANIQQALEVILVNIQNVVRYDRAGLILVEEGERYILSDMDIAGQLKAYPEYDPIVVDLKRTKHPLVVNDVHADTRFESWPDMDAVRGWLGAPLLIGDEMIGFLSLGSLEVGAYEESDATLMQIFANQVADVLEKAWLYEQSNRRTEELEELSNITSALEQAGSKENTLFAITDQIAKFIGADRGVLLIPDQTGEILVEKIGVDEASVGILHPRGKDVLWQVFDSRKSAVIPNIRDLMENQQPDLDPLGTYNSICAGMSSAAFVPLVTAGASFGVLCFAFQQRRRFSLQDARLFDTVAEIAGASLHRAIVLESLERQVGIRTQHLSTLYNINAITSEPLSLEEILDRVLRITLDSLNSKVGAIHLIEPQENVLQLIVEQNIPREALVQLGKLSLDDRFWSELIQSTSPVVLPDISQGSKAPDDIRKIELAGCQTYIAAPIRAKGQVLGALSLFGRNFRGYTLEDITLFMTIADQVGSYIERARLIAKAEMAAVVGERQRLARELHDSVTQLLYSQVLFAGAGLKVLDQGSQPLAEQYLERIDQAALQALKEMRLLVYELSPPDYLSEGLQRALQRRLDAVERRSRINARLDVQDRLSLDEAIEMGLYRIAEEALNNTLKHAEATSVEVNIFEQNGYLTLEISDDGMGFELEPQRHSGGMGLVNMHERTINLGGDLQVITAPGDGTRIVVRIEAMK